MLGARRTSRTPAILHGTASSDRGRLFTLAFSRRSSALRGCGEGVCIRKTTLGFSFEPGETRGINKSTSAHQESDRCCRHHGCHAHDVPEGFTFRTRQILFRYLRLEKLNTRRIQGHLAHKKHPPLRTLQEDYPGSYGGPRGVGHFL